MVIFRKDHTSRSSRVVSPMIVWYIVSLLYSTPKDGLQEILINVDKEQ